MPRAVVVSLLICMLSAAAVCQITQDPTAIAVVNKVVATAGGMDSLSTLSDYTASGQITYFWGDKPVTAQVTIRGRGQDAFRLDATLSNGTRTWSVINGQGHTTAEDGKTTNLAYHTALGLRWLTFPIPKLLLSLRDPNLTIVDKGLKAVDDKQFEDIHIESTIKNKLHAKLSTEDYLVDPLTFTLSEIDDNTHPSNDILKDIPHAVTFGNFQTVQGISVPLSVSEKVNGQVVWSIQLTQVVFNTGVKDTDF
jgi:hypothetical protein